VQLVIQPDGTIRCVYGEQIELRQLGRLSVRRASHVEPNEEGSWVADLSPVGGPKLGPYGKRSTALREEEQWLQANWLANRKK
jgi:hypothetical protein